jgi:hypothetical protein
MKNRKILSNRAEVSKVNYSSKANSCNCPLFCVIHRYSTSSGIIKIGIFYKPELFDPKLTRHFLQYARHNRTFVHCIEIFANIRHVQKVEFGGKPPSPPKTVP